VRAAAVVERHDAGVVGGELVGADAESEADRPSQRDEEAAGDAGCWRVPGVRGLGAGVAFPLAALGTQEPPTVGASRGDRFLRAVLYHLSRLVLNVFRSVPDILWALVFVVALGLGPFPGTLALAVHSAGILGKLYSEALEAAPARPVEALRATGASALQTFLFGRLPQTMSGFTSLTLYQWECNIRSAAILGFVGAGGIGQQILISMNLFNYPKVATLVGATMIVVLLVDRFSAAVRQRLIS
jgi:phosphonate transport system permease protein